MEDANISVLGMKLAETSEKPIAKKAKLADVSLNPKEQEKRLAWPSGVVNLDGEDYKFIAANPIEKNVSWLDRAKGNVKVTDYKMVPDYPECQYCRVIYTDFKKQQKNAVVMRTPVEIQLWYKV